MATRFTGACWAVCLALALTASPALSQGAICGDRDHVVERLKQGYGEAQQSLGLGEGGAVMEVWVSKETGAFTILRTLTNGRSCILAAGEAWRLKDLAAFLPGEAA